MNAWQNTWRNYWWKDSKAGEHFLMVFAALYCGTNQSNRKFILRRRVFTNDEQSGVIADKNRIFFVHKWLHFAVNEGIILTVDVRGLLLSAGTRMGGHKTYI